MALIFKTEQLLPDGPFQILDPVVIFPRTDGGVCLISAFHSDAMLPGESLGDFIMRRARLDVPRGRPFRVVQKAAVPDKAFRDAWVADFAAPDGIGGDDGRQDWDELGTASNSPHPILQTWGGGAAPAALQRGAFEVHMPRARLCHKQNMRARRAQLWPAIDAERGRAIDSKDAVALDAVALRAQELRDVTDHPDIEAAQTPDALKAVWSECLK